MKKMQIITYNNISSANKIHKDITQIGALSGYLRDESNVVQPVIRIAETALPVFNYARIPEFNRYYYLRDARAVRSGIWDIYLESDPLMSFDLSAVSGVVVETENGGSDYLESRQFIRNVKSKTDILNFSNGLLETGEYILITAGGGA